MKINLHMLKEDLKHLNMQGHLKDAPWVLRCSCLQACTSCMTDFREDIIYLILAKNLPSKAKFDGCPSILCIGEPSEIWRKTDCNFLYTETELSLLELMNLVSAEFARYREWADELQNILDKGLPLQMMAELSHKVIFNPIYVHGSSYSILLYSIPKEAEDNQVMKKYKKDFFDNYLLGNPISLEDINIMLADEEYRRAGDMTEPCIYSAAMFGFRTLFYNVRIHGINVARICFDEIITPITDRDFALIKILGHYIEKGISPEKTYNFERLSKMDAIMRNYIAGNPVSPGEAARFLEYLGWGMQDSYVCLVLKLQTHDNSSPALEPLALYLDELFSEGCYLIDADMIVFVCNLTKLDKTEEELTAMLLPDLRDSLLSAGISMVYHRFDELRCYYLQAKRLLLIGSEKNPTRWYFHFKDYHMDYLIDKMLEDTDTEALIPARLKELISYDRAKGTEYTKLLRVYLKNERNIAETAREVYMHRNTCIYRLQRMNELLRMNLDDPGVRLLLQITFQIMDANAEGNFPEKNGRHYLP